MISEERINQYLTNIDDCFAAGDFSSLYKTAKVLCKETDGKYSYFMGACYWNAWGTEFDMDKALYYLENAALNNDNYMYATFITGIIYYRKARYDKAIEWMSAAEKAGNDDAIVFIADSAAAIALAEWNDTRKCRLHDKVVAGVRNVKNYLNFAVEKYMEAANTAPQSMTNGFWCGFGNMHVLLYNLSTTGYLNLEGTHGGSLSANVSAGLHLFFEKTDNDAHDKIYDIGISACDFMAAHGAVLVAEYFRAFFALFESERHNSAEAFYRARWHMKRVGELRREADAQEAEELANTMTNLGLETKYKAQEKKYGNMVLGMMRSGEYPSINRSYGEGLAPAVESCENFMQMFKQEQSFANNENNKQRAKEKKSSGGLFKKLFKF